MDEVVATLESGWLTTGPRTAQFEEEFARYVGAEHAIGTNSGTAALHLALESIGVGPGDEVITTPLTFAATANAIEHCGARPVFADVDARDGNISAEIVAELLTEATRALLPVHYAGAPADLDALRRLDREIPIIVDAAHAIEMRTDDGRRSGAGVELGAYSFQVTKNITTGEGGMIVTTDPERAAELRVRRLHGVDKDAFRRRAEAGFTESDLLFAGHKYNMTDLQAAIGMHQLRRIEILHARRVEIWEAYNESFGDSSYWTVPPSSCEPDGERRHGCHLYTLWFAWDALGMNRAECTEALARGGVGVAWHYPPLHLQRYYRERYGHSQGEFPVAEEIARRTVTLPLSASMSDTDVRQVIAAVHGLAAERS
jgi:dTDP-4-amino-4,6-dideoxygalactose transaminase